MSSIRFNIISNNVKGLQSYKKRLKIFEYLKNKSGPNGILIFQATHSTKENELDRMKSLKVRYIIPMVNLIHAVFLLLFLVA